MSIQSVKEVNKYSVQDKVDNSIICASDRLIKEEKFGVKSNITDKDIFYMRFLKKLMEDRFCESKYSHKFLERIQKVVSKI